MPGRRARATVDSHPKVDYDLLAFTQQVVPSPLEVCRGMHSYPPFFSPPARCAKQVFRDEQWFIPTMFISTPQSHRWCLRPVRVPLHSPLHSEV